MREGADMGNPKVQKNVMDAAQAAANKVMAMSPDQLTAAGFGFRPDSGGRRRTLKASTLRRMLKKKGKKTTGKKATLLKRLKE